ncbi:small ribosomal subunit Rsm22 family protein [Nibricoccus sp. IMCC34717]|uniref:small ribosomal subunit Rsm22 family protein n=1 Tax=Nibricoccus sp. IMCC34717 TaxID=3034021 RepID=UPI00385104AD
MRFEELNWAILDRLRSGFLGAPGSKGVYWTSAEDLRQYDLCFGERIGWKWDAVLDELQRRGWSPPTGPVLDWGCGSGIAGRRVASAWRESATQLLCHDHSAFAVSHSVDAARKAGVAAESFDGKAAFSTLVISHVLNELPPEAEAALLACVERATAVLWVEPGTHEISRHLARLRDRLSETFTVVGPCTHARGCPLFAAGKESDWCHTFAEPPKALYADSDWVRFGQRAGVDLRSLPYAWLALDRRALGAAALPTGAGRRIGRPRLSKADAKWLQCDADGLAEQRITKREQPALWKALDKRPGLPLHSASREELYPHQRPSVTLDSGEPGPSE